MVDGMDVEAPRQEVRKVAAGSAPRVEDAGAVVERSFEQLVEEVDVDGAEEALQLRGGRRRRGYGVTFSAR